MRLIPSKFKYNLLVDFDISGIRIFNCQNFEDFNYDYLFKYREDTYLYEKSSNSYKYLQLDVHQSFRDIKSNSSGLSEKDHQNLMKLFGSWTMEISTVFDVVLSPCEFRRSPKLDEVVWFMNHGDKYSSFLYIIVQRLI